MVIVKVVSNPPRRYSGEIQVSLVFEREQDLFRDASRPREGYGFVANVVDAFYCAIDGYIEETVVLALKVSGYDLDFAPLHESGNHGVDPGTITDIRAARDDGLDGFGAATRGEYLHVESGFAEFAAFLAKCRLG
jgi:hypothetical protein